MAAIDYNALQMWGWSPWDVSTPPPAGYRLKMVDGKYPTIEPIAGYAATVPQTISAYNNTLSDADYATRNAGVLNSYYQAINPAFTKVDAATLAAMPRAEQEKYVADYITNAQKARDLQDKQKSGGFWGGVGDFVTDPANLLALGTMGMIMPNVSGPIINDPTNWNSYLTALKNEGIGLAGVALAGATAGGSLGMLGGEAITMSEAIASGATMADLADMGFTAAQIAAAAPSIGSASISSATGLPSWMSSAATNAAVGGVKGGITSGISGQNWLDGLVSGTVNAGTKGLISGGVNAGLGSMGDWWSNDIPTEDYIPGTSGAYGGLTGNILQTLGTGTPGATPQGGGGMGWFDGLTGDTDSSDWITGLSDQSWGSGGGSWWDSINWGNLASSALGGIGNFATSPTGLGMIGSLVGANAQNNASGQATNALNQSLAAQQGMYNQQRADFAPYRAMGEAGVNDYVRFVNGQLPVQNTPAYQFGKNEIDRNMNRQLAARGRTNSSYGMESLGRAYGQLASNEYQNQYNRMLDPIKIGQGAAASTGQAAQTMSNNYGQAGLAQAGLTNQQGANSASLYSNLGALPMQYQNMQNTQQSNQNFMNYLQGLGR